MAALQWVVMGLIACIFAMGSKEEAQSNSASAAKPTNTSSRFWEMEGERLIITLPVFKEEEIVPVIADLLESLSYLSGTTSVTLRRKYYTDLYKNNVLETIEGYMHAGDMTLEWFRQKVMTYMEVLSGVWKALGGYMEEKGLDEAVLSDFVVYDLFVPGPWYTDSEFETVLLRADSEDLSGEGLVRRFAQFSQNRQPFPKQFRRQSEFF